MAETMESFLLGNDVEAPQGETMDSFLLDEKPMQTLESTTKPVEVDSGVIGTIGDMGAGIVQSVPEAMDNSTAFFHSVLPKGMQEFLEETDRSIVKMFGGDEEDLTDLSSPTLLGDIVEENVTGELGTAGEVTKDISKVVLSFAITKKFAPKDLGTLKTIGVNTLRMLPGDLLFWSKNDKHIADIASDMGVQNAVVDFLKNDPKDPTWYHNLKGAIESAFIGTGLELAVNGLLRGYRGLQNHIHSNSTTEDVATNIVDTITKEPIVPSIVPDNIKATANKPPHTNINYNKNPLEEQGATELLLNSKSVRDAYNLDLKPQALTEAEAAVLQKSLGLDGAIDLAEGTLKNVKDLDRITLALRRELFDSSKRMGKAKDVAFKATGAEKEKAVMKYLIELDNFTRLAKNVKGVQTETARALSSMNIFAFDDSKLRAVMNFASDHPQQFDDVMAEALNGKSLSGKELDRALNVIKDIESGTSALEAGKKVIKEDSKAVKAMRVLLENMYNGILSNPITHKINMMGNLTSATARMGEHYVASIVGYGREAVNKLTDATYKGGNDFIRLNELAALHRGHLSGMWDTYRAIVNATKHLPEGTASFEDALQKGFLTNVGKLDEDAAARYLSGDYLNVGGKAGWAVDVAGSVNRSALMALGIEDDMFKRMAFNSHANYMAVREANKKGLKSEKARAKYIKDFLTVMDMQQTIKNGGTLSPEGYKLVRSIDATNTHYDEAILQAKEVTFQEELGKAGQDFIKFKKDAFGGAGNIIMPFVKTPTNLIKWLVRRTPGLNMISSKSRAMWAKGGRERDLVMGQLTLGTSLYGIAYSMYQDDKITGIAPQGHRAAWADAGILESSYVTDDGRTIQYNRADPIASFFNITASMGQFYDDMERRGLTEDSDFVERWDEVSFAFISAFSENTLNKTYTTGITEFLRAMDDPSPEKWTKYAKQKALMFAPGSGMARYLNEDSENNRKAAITMFEKLKDLYGNRDDLPYQPDVYGKFSPKPATFSGVQQRKISTSPIRLEIARLGLHLPSMSNKLNYKGIPIELNTKDLSAMRHLLESEFHIEDELNKVVNSQEYKAIRYDGIDWGTEGTKRYVLSGKLQEFHGKALELFMSKNPEALNQYVNGYYERVKQTKSNQPLSVERWLDKGTRDTSDMENFLKGN